MPMLVDDVASGGGVAACGVAVCLHRYLNFHLVAALGRSIPHRSTLRSIHPGQQLVQDYKRIGTPLWPLFFWLPGPHGAFAGSPLTRLIGVVFALLMILSFRGCCDGSGVRDVPSLVL